MRKLFVSDFDRTLYVDGKVSGENLSAICRWQEMGNLFAIATGRNIESLQDKIKSYTLLPDYLICNNGGAIYKGTACMQKETIPAGTAAKVTAYILENCPGSAGVSAAGGKWGVLGKDGVNDQKDAEDFIALADIVHLRDITQIHKRFQDEAWARNLGESLNHFFGNEITAYANVWNVDVVKKDVDKSRAISFIEAVDNISGAPFVIGDSANDVGMIKVYGGYTLAAAPGEIQAIATEIFRDVAHCLHHIMAS